MKPRVRLYTNPDKAMVTISGHSVMAHRLHMSNAHFLPSGNVGSYVSLEKAVKAAVKALRGRGMSQSYIDRYRIREEDV